MPQVNKILQNIIKFVGMNRHLDAIYINASAEDAALVPELLRDAGAVYHEIDILNWEQQYPYKPSVRFAVAHDGNSVLVHYQVDEQAVLAEVGEDAGRVWEDSCVEFFASPAGDGQYYNIECTCTGKLLVALGTGRSDREPAPASVLSGVRRWASLGSRPFGLLDRPTHWELALVIPASTFFRHDIGSLGGLTFGANFYKCGDRLPVPHFVTWNAVETPAPDYHRPECFGTITFR